MKKYIDFDGVIFDTEREVFKYYELLMKYKIYINKLRYVRNRNWEDVLANSEEINDAIRIINSFDDDTAILTRIYSLENEGVSKIRLLRDLGVEKEIILTPYQVRKSDVVPAKGNILVDDSIFNLDEWKEQGGISIFFNKNGADYDNRGTRNERYPKIKTLSMLKGMLNIKE